MQLFTCMLKLASLMNISQAALKLMKIEWECDYSHSNTAKFVETVFFILFQTKFSSCITNNTKKKWLTCKLRSTVLHCRLSLFMKMCLIFFPIPEKKFRKYHFTDLDAALEDKSSSQQTGTGWYNFYLVQFLLSSFFFFFRKLANFKLRLYREMNPNWSTGMEQLHYLVKYKLGFDFGYKFLYQNTRERDNIFLWCRWTKTE